MRKNPCEKCLEILGYNNCHLRCGMTGLEMRQLLYAHRCPDIPGASETTQRAQNRNREQFRVLSEHCVFWGGDILPEELLEIVRNHKHKK